MPRRKPHVPTAPVEWLETEAQMHGTVVETVKDDTPGKIRQKRRYRLHTLERMANARDPMARISERQKLAGLEIHSRWCNTQLSPPCVREIVVDSTPRPDDTTIAQVEAVQAFADIMRLVPSDMSGVVRHVCCDNLPITKIVSHNRYYGNQKAALQIALDLVANELGF